MWGLSKTSRLEKLEPLEANLRWRGRAPTPSLLEVGTLGARLPFCLGGEVGHQSSRTEV